MVENKPSALESNSGMYHSDSDIISDTIDIILNSRATAYRSINYVLLERNWLIGKRISEEELNAENIIPQAFDERVGKSVAAAVAQAARETGVARI